MEVKPKQVRKLNKKEHESHFDNLFDNNVSFRERIIYLNKDIDVDSLDLVLKAFDELERGDNPAPIRIEISSYGGSVYDMLGIVDRIRSSPCKVITRGFGKIMSAATYILASGDERQMGSLSSFMMHQMSDVMKGKVSDIKIEIQHNQQLEDRMYSLYETLSSKKVPAKKFAKMCQTDCYLTAEEVLDLGLIDQIIEPIK
jgi:ATP-dependent Clp protease protease subunit